MPERTQRREFLKTAGPAALLGPELVRGAHSWTSTSTATSEPGTHANPRLLTGCCAYSYSKLLKAGKMTMEDVIRKAVELGVAAVDMTAYWFKSTEPAYLASLRHLAYKDGVCFSGAAIGTSTVQADASKRAQVLEEIRKWIDVTEALGASHLRVFAVELGVAAVDMTAYWFKSTEPAYLASLRHLAYKDGVCFSGAAIGTSTVQADASKRAQVLEEIRKWIDVTEALGASHLRVFAGE